MSHIRCSKTLAFSWTHFSALFKMYLGFAKDRDSKPYIHHFTKSGSLNQVHVHKQW